MSILLSAFSLHAQKATEDVVYLKNGSIIRGTVLEMKIDTSVKIQTADRNVWVFPYGELSRVAREPAPSAPNRLMRTKGYYNVSELGFTFSQSEYGGMYAGFTADMVNGYRFNRYVSAGLLAGVDNMNGVYFKTLGLETRGEFRKATIAPFYFARLGWGFPPKSNYYYGTYTGGLMLNPGAGVKCTLNEGAAIVLSLSYKYQQMEHSYNLWDGSYMHEEVTFNKTAVTVGFMF